MVRLLNSVGKGIFARYFYNFRDLSLDEMINFLINNNISNYNGARRRTMAARELFRLGLEREALENIISSKRLSKEIRDMARQILDAI